MASIQRLERFAASTICFTASSRCIRRIRVSPFLSTPSVADLYRSLIRKEQKRTGAVPIAYQQTVSLEKREKHLLDPLLDSIRRISLRPALVLAGPTEIVVYHAEPQIMRFGRGSYGYTRTELPYGALKDVEVEKSATFVASVELGFTVPGHTITVTVDDAFPVDTVEAAAAASRADV
jgi:hypothetical protein